MQQQFLKYGLKITHDFWVLTPELTDNVFWKLMEKQLVVEYFAILLNVGFNLNIHILPRSIRRCLTKTKKCIKHRFNEEKMCAI